MMQAIARSVAQVAGQMSLALARGSGRRRDLARWAAALRAAAHDLDALARRSDAGH